MLFLILMFLTRQCLAVSNQSTLEGRIVKGYEVGMYQYPHSVFLHFNIDVPSCCGSSLITDQAVITSAVCFHELQNTNGKITAFLGEPYPMNAHIKRDIVFHSIHPKYNPEKGKFNLGIAFFNKPVPFSKEVQKIPIVQIYLQENEAVFTTGWGKDKPFKLPDYSDRRHIKTAKHRILSDRDCADITGLRKTPVLWCTASINGYHYHGDYGNGLVTISKSLVGVVSYMINELTVYSDVMREQLWINNTLVDLLHKSCNPKKGDRSMDKWGPPLSEVGFFMAFGYQL